MHTSAAGTQECFTCALQGTSMQRMVTCCVCRGGAAGATQVNDTRLHDALSGAYQEQEQAAVLAQMEIKSTGCPRRGRDDCVADIAEVWSRPE